MRDKKSFDYIDTTPDVSLTYDRAGRRAGTSDAPGNHALTYDDAASGDRVSGWSVSDAGAWKPATTRLRYNQRTRKNHCNQCFENPLAHIMPGMNGTRLSPFSSASPRGSQHPRCDGFSPGHREERASPGLPHQPSGQQTQRPLRTPRSPAASSTRPSAAQAPKVHDGCP